MCAPCLVCSRTSSGPGSGNFQQCFGLVLERGSWTRGGRARGTRGAAVGPAIDCRALSTQLARVLPAGCTAKLGQPTVYFTTKLYKNLHTKLYTAKQEKESIFPLLTACVGRMHISHWDKKRDANATICSTKGHILVSVKVWAWYGTTLHSSVVMCRVSFDPWAAHMQCATCLFKGYPLQNV
jgi:hypothetical protein